MFPVVIPGERRGSPHSPQLTHTHRGHQLGEVGRAGARSPSEPRCARLPRQRGTPHQPQIPRDPFSGGTDPTRGRDSKQSPLSCVPGQPSPSSGGSAPTAAPAAPSRAGSPGTHSQSLAAPAAATYQHVSLHFSRLKHCLFLHCCRVCACVCCSPRVT